MNAPPLAFAADPAPQRPAKDETLLVDVDGFAGPLDLLLSLAREQKVDLGRISILALAEQYLAFIEAARRLRIEMAADYLVMAAWLAYLKSRLLLPAAEADEEPSGEALAAALALRLRRLEAMRDAAARLMNRNRLGRDVFARGQPEPLAVSRSAAWEATLYDLLEAYAAQRQRRLALHMRVAKRAVFSLQEARDRLVRLIGGSHHWLALDALLAEYLGAPELRATARASALSASLELVKEGRIELRQSAPFAPLYLRGLGAAVSGEAHA